MDDLAGPTFASMRVQRRALSDLNAASYNPRTRLAPSSPAYGRLKESILTFGNVQPIVVNERTGNIVGGHQRYWILRDDLGELEDDVVIVDLDDAKEKALNIALNKPAGEWDNERLVAILRSMDEGDLRLAQHGMDEIDDMERMMRLGDSTDFLGTIDDIDSFMEGKASVGAAELKEDHPHRTGEQFYTFQLVFSRDQRETVMKAIELAKGLYGLSTSMEGITAVCQQFLDDRDT